MQTHGIVYRLVNSKILKVNYQKEEKKIHEYFTNINFN